MTIQEFSDFFDACKGQDLKGIRLNAKRLDKDGIESVAKAFACTATPESVSKAVLAYLIENPIVLRRGTKVFAIDGYPYFVTTDTPIPSDAEQAKQTQVPCTSIIAYGDKMEEQEYKVMLTFGELTC